MCDSSIMRILRRRYSRTFSIALLVVLVIVVRFVGRVDDPLTFSRHSGSLNERIRDEYVHVEIDSRSWRSVPDRRIWRLGHESGIDPTDRSADRIVAQMFHVPRNYRRGSTPQPTIKSIFIEGMFGDTPMGRKKFEDDGCPVDACRLTNSSSEIDTADLLLLRDFTLYDNLRKPPGQIWMVYLLESPATIKIPKEFKDWSDHVNWTATYRWDSTIVTPYAKFVQYRDPTGMRNRDVMSKGKGAIGGRLRRHDEAALTRPNVDGELVPPMPKRNYAAGKTKMVAWFVSNCFAHNRRREYMEELSSYISVDVYGICGRKSCPRDDTTCMPMILKEYKFYLSFENSNCDYYITEKFFENALLNDVVPIVMGGRMSDYLLAAPPHSYIHVEQLPSARYLAKYLHRLDQSDELYNEYFAWKGTGEFINTKFWCRVCALLHDDDKPTMWYTDFNKWWSHDGASCHVRSRDSWK